MLSGVTTGKYDMAISALAYTPERAEAMELSDGYYDGTEDTGYGLMVRTEDLAAITARRTTSAIRRSLSRAAPFRRASSMNRCRLWAKPSVFPPPPTAS